MGKVKIAKGAESVEDIMKRHLTGVVGEVPGGKEVVEKFDNRNRARNTPTYPVEEEGTPAAAPAAEAEAPRDDKGRFTSGSKEALSALDWDAPLFEVPYRGRPTNQSLNELLVLANQGMDYTKKMTAMKSDKKDWDQFVAYRDYLNQNPDLARYQAGVAEEYHRTGKIPSSTPDVPAAPESFTGWDEDGNEILMEAPAAVPDAVTTELKALKEQNEALMRRLDAKDTREKASTIVRECEDAIDSDDFLKGLSLRYLEKSGGQQDKVLEKLVALKESDPDADTSLLARQVATEYRQELETLGVDPYVKAKEEDQERFSSESPSGGSGDNRGVVPEETKLTGRDLRSGRVGKEALRFLEARLHL